MKKVFLAILLIGVLAGLLLAPQLSYCQQLSDAETKIYYELAEKVYVFPTHRPKTELIALYKEIVQKHGVSFEQLINIRERAWDYGITPREREILNELKNRQKGRPLMEQLIKVYDEVAKDYGFHANVLHDMKMRDSSFTYNSPKTDGSHCGWVYDVWAD